MASSRQTMIFFMGGQVKNFGKVSLFFTRHVVRHAFLCVLRRPACLFIFLAAVRYRFSQRAARSIGVVTPVRQRRESRFLRVGNHLFAFMAGGWMDTHPFWENLLPVQMGFRPRADDFSPHVNPVFPALRCKPYPAASFLSRMNPRKHALQTDEAWRCFSCLRHRTHGFGDGRKTCHPGLGGQFAEFGRKDAFTGSFPCSRRSRDLYR